MGLSRYLLVLLVAGSCLSLTCAQILPIPVCLTTRTIFVSQGCVTNQNVLLCQVLAFIHLFQFEGKPLCNSFPCEGYGQPAMYSCQGLGGCGFAEFNADGICNPLQTCCPTGAVRQSDAPLDKSAAAVKILLTAASNSSSSP